MKENARKSAAVIIGPLSIHKNYASADTPVGRVYINTRMRSAGYTHYTFTKLPLAQRGQAARDFVRDHGGRVDYRLDRDGNVVEHRVRVDHGE